MMTTRTWSLCSYLDGVGTAMITSEGPCPYRHPPTLGVSQTHPDHPARPTLPTPWEKVKDNKGAPGVDGCSIEDIEADLKNNLYRIWNRMSSGSYFPPPVKAVEIPKPHGGVRVLGVPTVADRIAQTVVAMEFEKRVEPMFHPDSYGYRPGRSALDAVGTCRRRCWENDW